MKYCINCSSELQDNQKFCSKCGYKVKDDNELNKQTEVGLKIKEKTRKKKSNKFFIFAIIFIIAAVLISIGIYYKVTTDKINSRKIEVLNTNTENYPNIEITIKASNYNKDIVSQNLTIKEGDTIQKNVSVKKSSESGEYILSYKTNNEENDDSVNFVISYLADNREVEVKDSYKVEKKSRKSIVKSDNSNNIKSSSNSEKEIKNFVNKYQTAFIKAVNTKDISYVIDLLDHSGTMDKEFSDLLESYKKQDITESLLEFEVEDIKQIDDNSYEVTIYAGYHINYGNKNESSDLYFRDIHIIKKTTSGYKLNKIKEVNKVNKK